MPRIDATIMMLPLALPLFPVPAAGAGAHPGFDLAIFERAGPERPQAVITAPQLVPLEITYDEAEEEPQGIRIKWKLNKVKMRIPL